MGTDFEVLLIPLSALNLTKWVRDMGMVANRVFVPT